MSFRLHRVGNEALFSVSFQSLTVTCKIKKFDTSVADNY